MGDAGGRYTVSDQCTPARRSRRLDVLLRCQHSRRQKQRARWDMPRHDPASHWVRAACGRGSGPLARAVGRLVGPHVGQPPWRDLGTGALQKAHPLPHLAARGACWVAKGLVQARWVGQRLDIAGSLLLRLKLVQCKC